MGLLVHLLQQIRAWDTVTKFSLALAIVLMAILAFVGTSGPEALRTPAFIGAAGLIIVSQLIIMWGNRHMVTPYTQAQRHFMSGDFAAARDTLLAFLSSQEREGKRLPVDAMVLLGNSYRNLGELAASEEALRRSLDIKPLYHFPLYGLGRTLISDGRYNEAASLIAQSLDNGAPPVVWFDLAHAQYRAGDHDAALNSLERAAEYVSDEPHRQLMSEYLLYRLGEQAWRPQIALLKAGLPFWQAEAERFAHTSYGQALSQDLAIMQAVEESV